MGQVEAWTTLVAPSSSRHPSDLLVRAARLEADGWDGATVVDSQCLMGDAFSMLSLAASATSRLKFGTGTSNPLTRHPSVLANAAATVHALSDGRMSLGLGRGDSALAYIGAPPVPVRYFARALAMIQNYLKGIGTPASEAAELLGATPLGPDGTAAGHMPELTKLQWLPDDLPPVTVEVAASGPKVISVAARYADCISFSVGADVARLKWALSVAREELDRSGRDPGSIRFGAYIPLYPHHDLTFARELSLGMVAAHSRFSVMNKKVVGPASESQRENLARVAESYDMNKHGQATGGHAEALSAEYIDQFAIVGDPQRCVDRIGELVDLGIERFHFWTADTNGRAGESYTLAVEEILSRVPNRSGPPAAASAAPVSSPG
ncbi:LLM class flavin-dependent oxidoreductase [Nocardia salmonicida]|uniref:LLM class flavin-dependent oxidoreductase n=1 Tax=Nocardia salmonicida TaxID=53431 RepID=UPI00340CDCF4